MGISFKKYKYHKDSGIKWLGNIPKHWEIKRLKDLGESIIGITYSPEDLVNKEEDGTLVLRSSNIQNNKLSLKDCVFIKNYIKDKRTVRVGDILICARNGSRNLIGKNICIDKRIAGCTFGAFMTVYRSKYFSFIVNFFNSQMFNAQSGLFMSSTINQLTINTLRNFIIPLPPIVEQQIMVDYLYTKIKPIDEKINLLIYKAKKYIELKRSLINETVTYGLDTNVPMKDSGVEWIRKIPEHWDISSISKLTQPVSIKNKPEEELLSVYRDYGVIIKSTRDDNNNKAGKNLSAYKFVKPGFLVINKMKTWQGSLGVSAFQGIVSPAYITCKTNKKMIERRFLHHLLRSKNYINEYNRLSYGVRVDQWDMRYDDFKYVPVLVPPKNEQKAIADYLDTKAAQIDEIITTINTQIEKLTELRKTLINDVVTGKIKVV
jgi:type I restriction enzyme, S subunit